jgi:2-polyprenyl-6-methoxyphenol hydroxylase-like FAD-dependent oxidoreductase
LSCPAQDPNTAVALRLDGEGALMPRLCGDHAIIIGAGMGGLAAAAALAGHFEHITVLERDEVGYEPVARPGVAQSRHLHGLLTGGLRALCELFPDFDRYLAEAGAVPIRVAFDTRMEVLPGHDAFPQRDFGWTTYTMSRPLIEHVARQRLRKQANVMLLDRCRVLDLEADDDGSVTGVRCAVADGPVRSLRADLVIDASARGSLTLALLKAMGLPQPEQTEIGIDMVYATATFAAPELPASWKMAITFPDNPSSGKSGYLFPIEGGRWAALVGERHVAMPPDSVEDFLERARQLRTSTIYDTLKHAKPVDKIHRFGFAESSWRHYERIEAFPRGLFPIGDAICRFNPIHGQGMTVAAQEACALKSLLATQADNKDPLDGLAQAFFAAIKPVIAGAWSMSAVPDFANPATRGQPPDDLENSLRFGEALMRLAMRDARVHELMLAVRHLITPATALREPDLVRRVQMEMADL